MWGKYTMNKYAVLALALCLKGFSLGISPVDLEITSDKGQGYYTLINDGNSQKVVVVTTKSREIDLLGQNKLKPTKDLIVYPKQVILKPLEKRLVRVIWKAKSKLSAEKAYRIEFTEKNIDVDFGEEDLGKDERRAGLSFGVKFEGSIYIQPKKGCSSKIEVKSYEDKKIEGEDYLVVTIHNSGTKHKSIKTKDLELEFLSKKGNQSDWHLFSEEMLERCVGKAMVLLADGKREIRIPKKEIASIDNIVGVRITE